MHAPRGVAKSSLRNYRGDFRFLQVLIRGGAMIDKLNNADKTLSRQKKIHEPGNFRPTGKVRGTDDEYQTLSPVIEKFREYKKSQLAHHR
jgi:hypothetical protein